MGGAPFKHLIPCILWKEYCPFEPRVQFTVFVPKLVVCGSEGNNCGSRSLFQFQNDPRGAAKKMKAQGCLSNCMSTIYENNYSGKNDYQGNVSNLRTAPMWNWVWESSLPLPHSTINMVKSTNGVIYPCGITSVELYLMGKCGERIRLKRILFLFLCTILWFIKLAQTTAQSANISESG